jgi:hypothetical protein
MNYVAVYLRAPRHEWPVDYGDDPSFLSSDHHRCAGGVLTWGVCRRNVRSQLARGEVVVFIAADRLQDRRPARYSLAGWATVDTRVSQAQLWNEPELALYQQLLIRPCADGFEHWEPDLPRRDWHPDWLWRIAETRGHQKKDFDHIQHRDRVAPGDVIDGQAVRFRQNYVMFCREGEGTTVLTHPPTIAFAATAGEPEKWTDDAIAQELRNIVLGQHARTLRTTNIQRAHPHIRLPTPSDDLCRKLEALRLRHGLRTRIG